MGKPKVEIKTVEYKDAKAMDRGNKDMVKHGWRIVNVQVAGGGFAPGKTILLGVLFLPAALLGKKSDVLVVTYERST